MQKSDYDILSIQDKGEILFTNGAYLAVRKYYGFTLNLYSLYDFFVEVWYDPIGNYIEKIEALQDEKTLDRYIDYMNKLNSQKKHIISIGDINI